MEFRTLALTSYTIKLQQFQTYTKLMNSFIAFLKKRL